MAVGVPTKSSLNKKSPVTLSYEGKVDEQEVISKKFTQYVQVCSINGAD